MYLYCFLEALGTVFLVFVALEAGSKIYGFMWLYNGSRVVQVAGVNHPLSVHVNSVTADG